MPLQDIEADLPQAERDQAFFDELLCIADSKFILGNWYFIALPNGRSVPDWTALCAMLQNHYGHARAIYRYLTRFGFTREEAQWHRPAQSIRSLRALDRPPESWSDFVVTCHLCELAFALQLEAICHSEADPALARLAAKIGNETQFHLSYFEGWQEVVSKGLSHAVQGSLRQRLAVVLEWWGPSAGPDLVHRAGWRATEDAALRARFLMEIEDAYGPLPPSPDADRQGAAALEPWRRSIRRAGPSGIPAPLHELIRFKEPELAIP